MGTIRDAARQPIEVDLTPHHVVCERCGIAVRFLSLATVNGAWIHAEPRSLLNDFHNGTPDHNAVVTR